jgi:hypothetical protein
LDILVVGHAVVSADGMIANSRGAMPAILRSEADWQRFQRALDAAALVVLGRLGHEAHPNPGRRRLVVTSSVAGLEPDPGDAQATRWNPAGLPFEAALAELGIGAGTVAVTGGTRVFDLFVPHFTRFDLVEMEGVTLPGGRPCFSAGSPSEVLAGAFLRQSLSEILEPGVRLTVWRA